MLRYLSGVVTLQLDASACTGCGMCATVCPHAVFAVENGKARIVACDACMECGACARNCPAHAIRVRAGVGCATGVLFSRLGAPDCCCSEATDCGGDGSDGCT